MNSVQSSRPVCDHFVSLRRDTIERRLADMSDITQRQPVLYRTTLEPPDINFLPDFRDFWQLLRVV